MTTALLERCRDQERRRDYRTGTVAAAAMNAMGGLGGEALGPEHFFPSLREGESEGGAESTLQALAAAFGLTIEVEDIEDT